MSRALLAAAAALLLVPGPGRLPASEAWRDADEERVLSPRPALEAGAAVLPAVAAVDDERVRGLEEGPWPADRVAALKADRHRQLPLADELTATPAGTAAPRPGIVSRIGGLNREESGGFFPPDTSIGVGPDRLVQAVNTHARLFDRDGAVLDSERLQEHFAIDPRADVTDPKVQWDPFAERFVMVVLELDFDSRQAWLNVSLSRDAAPASLGPAEWCNYRLSTVHADSWGDYPGLGLNDRWIAVSTNNFGFESGFVESRLFVFDKAKVAGTLATCPSLPSYTFNLVRDSAGTFVFNPQPAQHYEASDADATLFAVSSDYGYGDTYTLWRIVAKKGKPKLRDELVYSSAYSLPPNALQPDNLELDSGDNRVMQQLSYRDGQLWLAHSTGCTVKGSGDVLSCARVVAMRPDATGGPAVEFEATLGRKGEYFFWPGVVVAGNGDVVVAALRSGVNRYLETAVFGMKAKTRRFVEPLAVAKFGKPRTSEPGVCTPINVSRNSFGVAIARSGDYLGLVLDPASDDLWVSGEHGSRTIVGGCIWATDLVRIRF